MSLDDAREAVYERAASLAKDASPSDLNVLAEAVQRVAFGPQGAVTDYRYTAQTKQKTKQETTQHTHQHHHDDRERTTGFAR